MLGSARRTSSPGVAISRRFLTEPRSARAASEFERIRPKRTSGSGRSRASAALFAASRDAIVDSKLLRGGDAIEYREKELRGIAADEGRSFRGVNRVKEQDPFARPTTEEAIGRVNPLFASRNKERLEQAKAEQAEWDDNYADALVGYFRRDPDVVFPSGTWWMRVFHKVRCEAPP